MCQTKLLLATTFNLSLLFLRFHSISSWLLQNATFYTEPDCKGQIQQTIFTWYDSTDSKTNTSLSNARSAKIFGLWRYIVKDPQSDIGSFGWIFVNATNYKCNYGTIFDSNLFMDQSFNFKYTVLYRLGPSDLHTSALSLYPEFNFKGKPIEIIDKANLSEHFQPKSLIFTGIKSWTLYTDFEYHGHAYIVKFPTSAADNFPLNFIHVVTLKLHIGSIKQGADRNSSGFIISFKELLVDDNMNQNETYNRMWNFFNHYKEQINNNSHTTNYLNNTSSMMPKLIKISVTSCISTFVITIIIILSVLIWLKRKNKLLWVSNGCRRIEVPNCERIADENEQFTSSRLNLMEYNIN